MVALLFSIVALFFDVFAVGEYACAKEIICSESFLSLVVRGASILLHAGCLALAVCGTAIPTAMPILR